MKKWKYIWHYCFLIFISATCAIQSIRLYESNGLLAAIYIILAIFALVMIKMINRMSRADQKIESLNEYRDELEGLTACKLEAKKD